MGPLLPDHTGGLARATLRVMADTASAAGAVPRARHGRDPVVLVGGYATSDPQLEALRGWLEALDYDVTSFTTGYGIGCPTRAAHALTERIRRIAAAGQPDTPVHVIGHSRGGQFARVAVHQVAAAGAVRLGGLITLGTPFAVRGRDLGVHALAYGTGLLGTLGVPGLVTLSCMRGRCCEEFRATMAAPWPTDVPFTSVHGLSDVLVPPRACDEPAARTVAVPTGHLGLLHDPDALLTVADTLAAHTTRAVAGPARLRPTA